ncbi:hypothetical protein LX36DRAFT_236448 [Colletotrichum falcatum]|nr:hypothetical protein LX36DRAFT_236448 [Colletotrichum falcatum]
MVHHCRLLPLVQPVYLAFVTPHHLACLSRRLVFEERGKFLPRTAPAHLLFIVVCHISSVCPVFACTVTPHHPRLPSLSSASCTHPLKNSCLVRQDGSCGICNGIHHSWPLSRARSLILAVLPSKVSQQCFSRLPITFHPDFLTLTCFQYPRPRTNDILTPLVVQAAV